MNNGILGYPQGRAIQDILGYPQGFGSLPPTQLSGLPSLGDCIAYWHGNSGVVGSPVSQWTDLFDIAAGQPSLTLQPNFSNSVWNGRPGIVFAGSGGVSPASADTLSAKIALSTTYTFVMAIKTPLTRLVQPAGVCFLGVSATGIRWGLAPLNNDATNGLGWAGTNSSVNLGNATAFSANTDYLMCYTKSTTQWQIWSNGSLLTTVTDSSTPSLPPVIVIGAENNAGQYSSNNSISALAIYSRVLSNAEILSLANLIP